MTTASIEVPHVYTALAAVLKDLSVEKGGTLPGNMGGKPYITASDAAMEVKRQFVKNNLIFLPHEEVIKHENMNGSRLQVSIVVTGTYEIISTVDGSSVTVSGTGDGLATGTAVASNIASTNAFKNALLRTFLITEQSVEDSAKQGDETPNRTATPNPTSAQHKVEAAKAKTATGGGELAQLNERIRKYIGAPVDEAKRNAVNAAIEEQKAAGLNATEARKKVIKDLEID